MPAPLTFILKRVPSGVSTSTPRVASAGMGRKALLWSRAELGLLPGLSVPICEARKMMAPPHGCCEDELNVSKAQVQNQAPRTPHGWGLLALRERTRARGLLPPPPPTFSRQKQPVRVSVLQLALPPGPFSLRCILPSPPLSSLRIFVAPGDGMPVKCHPGLSLLI